MCYTLFVNHSYKYIDRGEAGLFNNGLSPGQRRAIIWTNAGILLIRTSGTNFSDILSDIHTFSFKKMHLKMSSGKWRPFCLGLNVLKWRERMKAIFSCDQAALQMVFSVCLSVCPSVCPSVCHTFFTMFPSSYHHEIFRSYYHGQKWCPCKRSRSEVKGQGHRGQHPT